MRPLCGYPEHNRGVAKRDIYLSDDLDQRSKAAGIKVSPLCQPVIGYAVLHGQAAAEAALRNLGTAADDGQDQEQLHRIEQLLNELHQREPGQQHQASVSDWAKMAVLCTAVMLATVLALS